MRKLAAVLILSLILVSTPGCSIIRAGAAYVCDRKQEITLAVDHAGEAASVFVGPLGTASSWLINFILDSACKALEVAASLPELAAQDVKDTTSTINPFTTSDGD